MRRLAPLLLVGVVLMACPSGASRLQDGRWTGTLTPMNHPDMQTPIALDVRTTGGSIEIVILGPDGGTLPAREIDFDDDTLAFTFDEPEAGIPLRCDWTRQPDGGFAGRCTDPEGKWAHFEVDPAE